MPAIDLLHSKESMWFISPWLQIQFSIPMSRNWLNAMTNANSAAIWYARAPSAQRRRRRTTFVHISHFAACYAKCSGKKHPCKKLLIREKIQKWQLTREIKIYLDEDMLKRQESSLISLPPEKRWRHEQFISARHSTTLALPSTWIALRDYYTYSELVCHWPKK